MTIWLKILSFNPEKMTFSKHDDKYVLNLLFMTSKKSISLTSRISEV